MWNLSKCDCECNKVCIIDEYSDIETCSRKKCLTGRSMVACKDEMLNRTETSADDKKVTCKKVIAFFKLFHC